MSAWDQQALESNFQGWKTERAPNIPVDQAFERYSIEQVLKDDDLSDEELEYGMLGGSDDGGVDGFFFFVNRTLMIDESELPDPAISVDIKVIQAKNKNGFSEEAIEKLASFARDLLDYTKPPDSFNYYNSSVQEAIKNFRDKYTEILGSQHTLNMSFYYVTKADQPPNAKVDRRADGLRQIVKKQLSAAQTSVIFWGCSELLSAARTTPKTKLTLDFSKQWSTDDGSVVCLVNLKSYSRFLSDDHGSIRRSLLERKRPRLPRQKEPSKC